MTYNWRVIHPAHGEVEIKADSKLLAAVGAAKFWKVPFTPAFTLAISTENRGEYKLPVPKRKNQSAAE